ncbi:DUF2283 domain-containing protein [Thermus sediminis]|uniref:DUF2283 domain-containing protein n=1 Tax=Thermus sediminis TaxID=1761908 RepID=UPI000E3B6627|nr:DUF2283 domain-containing protein [Thermus sediminis]
MRITYDREADALYIAFGEGAATVEEVAEGIALDRDGEGRLLGIEILDASKRLPLEALRCFASEGERLKAAPGLKVLERAGKAQVDPGALEALEEGRREPGRP